MKNPGSDCSLMIIPVLSMILTLVKMSYCGQRDHRGEEEAFIWLLFWQ